MSDSLIKRRNKKKGKEEEEGRRGEECSVGRVVVQER